MAGFKKQHKTLVKIMWCILPESNTAFVCQMERVLQVYERPMHRELPVVCMDESSVRCTKEIRAPIPAIPGHNKRYDTEYQRNGVAQLLALFAPFEGLRRVNMTDNHKTERWAQSVRWLVQQAFSHASKITPVNDNLNTRAGASLYKAFEPELAASLLEKLEFVYTPKHGSLLNLTECEFSVPSRQCLDSRLPDIDTVASELAAWQTRRKPGFKTSGPADNKRRCKD